jgi:hypothetical protein
VETRRLQALLTERTGAVGPGERRDDQVARLDRADVGTDRFDDADELVAHSLTGLARLELVVGPEVAAADAGARDADECVCRFDESCVGDVLDPDIAGAVHDSCFHDGTEAGVCAW